MKNLSFEVKAKCYEHLIDSHFESHYDILEKLKEFLPDLDNRKSDDDFLPHLKELDFWKKLSIPQDIEKHEYLQFLYEFVDSLDVDNSDYLRDYQTELLEKLYSMLDPKGDLIEKIKSTELFIEYYERNWQKHKDELAVLKEKLAKLDEPTIKMATLTIPHDNC